MNETSQARRRVEKNLQNSFSRKKETILKKMNALCLDKDNEIYFVLRRRGTFYTYISSEKESWPPTAVQIVRLPQFPRDNRLLIARPERKLPSTSEEDTS